MLPKTIALAIELSVENGPPKEFCLFKAGTNRTLKGDFVYSERSREACAEFASGRGAVQSVIDYEHASISAKNAPDPAEAGKAAGWFTVEARPEGVFAVNVTWTKRAQAALSAREFRYFSPVAFFDAKTREITAIVNAALTNNPATLDQEPLVASAGASACTPKEPAMKSLLALLSLPLDASEQQAIAALERLKKEAIDTSTAMLAITGKATLAEAVGTMSAWKEAAMKVEALTAKLAEFEVSSKAKDIDTVVQGAIDAKKFTPAQKAFLRKIGERDLAELRAFVEASPVMAVGVPRGEPRSEPTESSLSAAEKEVAALLNIDLKSFASAKARVA